ncbi:CotH kinase family protein [Prevotella sp. E15-22]|uniref:CotH kinase family protein n=1 Tax=Prevotella sp. E15-22 TaxID=2937774 RepID=UPI00205B8EBB|nr:CotH kinase family protein [Prevotella sp. E15-22]UPS43576.1 CotH kinase family protein [Prevotella sp. E15-22]
MLAICQIAFADEKLTGAVIGTKETVDYGDFSKSTTVNTCMNAFDGDLNTYFASWERSYTWVGLDLGESHVITRVGWSPRKDGQGDKRILLGVFEGANREDFMDALPIYVITEKGQNGLMSYADVQCSRGFRYVRYVGPSDARCNIAELEFYGYQGVGNDSSLYQLTNLPTVSIHTQDNEIPYDKKHQIVSQLTIISDNGTKLLSESGTIRERGNFSRSFPKKPYRIKFDKKQRVLDAPAKAKKWTLINNYGDKTLMRNLLAFELSRRLGMTYTPFGAAVDVILNGEYKGCYQLCDQVNINKNRVNITEMTSQDNEGTALTGGYFVEVDAYADQENSWFRSTKGTPVTIKSPDEDSITIAQKNYIMNYFNKMEVQWKSYLDLNSFLRHFLVGELSGNTDTYWSMFMYKERGDDMMYTGPVWDFDLAFENDNRTYPINSKKDYIYRSYGSCTGNMRNFVDEIVVNDVDAKSLLAEIWAEARQSGLTEEYMLAYIDSLENALQQSQNLNFIRWPIMNQGVHQNPRIWGSYQAEVENVRTYMKERIAWMDKKLNYTFAPNGIADVAVDMTKAYQVYTLSGRYCGAKMEGLQSGIYLLRQGKVVKKVVVK